MSDKNTKEKPNINFVLNPQTSLNGGAGFTTRSRSGGFPTQPQVGKALKPYAAAGNKHIAQQIIFTQKAKAAIVLQSQAFVHSVADMSYTAQVSRAIAQAVPDEEISAFLKDYVDNGLNFMAVSHAHFLEILREQLDDLIQQGLEPTLFERIFGP